MFRVICIVIGYFFGCFQSAYIIGKVVAKIDIREHGSGNAGTTNTIRVIGKIAGLSVFALDILKTVIAYVICAYIFKENEVPLPGIYAGVGVILGHNFPVFLKFKGGKGAASLIGLILCIDWRAAVIAYVCGFISLAATRFVSLASLIISLLTPVTLVYFQYSLEVIIISVLVMILSFFQHRENIGRLIKGKESKLVLKKPR